MSVPWNEPRMLKTVRLILDVHCDARCGRNHEAFDAVMEAYMQSCTGEQKLPSVFTMTLPGTEAWQTSNM
jgi:hypothetical protein